MSTNNDHTALLIGGAALLYMMMQRRAAVAPTSAAPRSMPGNVGTGWQQVATGAVAGFLQQLATGPKNATSTTVFPSYTVQDSEVVQDVVPSSFDLTDYLNGAESLLA